MMSITIFDVLTLVRPRAVIVTLPYSHTIFILSNFTSNDVGR